MLEWAQQVLDQLQADPDLSEMTGSPVDNPERIQVGTSGPEFIDVDEIVGLDDLEFTMPPVGSPTGVVTQPEAVWVPVETSASNPLSEFIKIYDDDESPEVSLGTPVHIEEEKGPDKTSSPVPEVQIKEVPQKEKEVESGLDTKRPDAPETRADNPEDKSEPE
jgi:hypothetical protein